MTLTLPSRIPDIRRAANLTLSLQNGGGEGPKNGMPFGLAYSFDKLLPIVRLREKHYTIDLAGLTRYYFYVHRMIGWALASFLVAGLSGITQ